MLFFSTLTVTYTHLQMQFYATKDYEHFQDALAALLKLEALRYGGHNMG